MKKKPILILCLLLGLSNVSDAQYAYRLIMSQLICNKTTEAGEDEIYILVNGKASNGDTWNFRMPGNAQHWDLNDGNEPRQVRDWVLAQTSNALKINESVTLNVIVMEEDGGQVGQLIMNNASEMLASTGNPYAMAGAGAIQVAKALGVGVNTDDYIGSFTITISRSESGVSSEFTNFDRCYWAQSEVNYPQGSLIQFTGDGSNYLGVFQYEFGNNWQ